MNRIAGIVIAALGFVAAILSVLKIVPGLTQPGVMMIVLGGIIIGLSFVNGPEQDETERMSTPNTLLNIFLSPSETFQNLRRHPRWLVAVIIMTILSGVYANLFLYRLTPEHVANYTIDKTLEMPMIAGNEAARKQVEEGRQAAIDDAKNPVSRVGQMASGFAWLVIGFCVLAGIFLLFALAMGGQINFWQAFSVAVYAWFPATVIKFILNTVILFVKDPTEIHPIVGQGSLIQDNLNFLVAASENPVIYSLLGGLSLLWFYWIWLNATGLKNGGEKVSGSIAWTTTLVIYVVVLLLGTAAVWMFPSFVS